MTQASNTTIWWPRICEAVEKACSKIEKQEKNWLVAQDQQANREGLSSSH